MRWTPRAPHDSVHGAAPGATGDADALAYIARHHGLPAPALTPRTDRQDPAGLEQLGFRALSAGLRSRAVRLEAASLDHLQLPCLLLHRQLGWTPLVAVHDGHVTLHHPAQGRLRLAVDALAMEFSGLALEFRPAR
ncbi:cysteine peptidase family C39 domain-containing protein [Pelomonas sp. APW6]|uniref:Cysteine peptidase family C39 domain-containing protein n=1 Tax=Roseateles subflavus TaxID=3053353 RepID=A0ABT7LCY5_9BURK|nr:cysteine peptidase family C39 domain-containing protein [Pelomonas sp. APW6]MDL5030721.1 cysteine peptidase family C39 domain-containing protein [Pelomonas sp. APW6]